MKIFVDEYVENFVQRAYFSYQQQLTNKTRIEKPWLQPKPTVEIQEFAEASVKIEELKWQLEQ